MTYLSKCHFGINVSGIFICKDLSPKCSFVLSIIVDGFIVATDANEFFVGDSIYSECKPYILEEEPLKIEVGKWYETRDHQKARCFAITAQGACYSFTIDNGFVFYTYKGGKYGIEKECSLDIIATWKEDK